MKVQLLDSLCKDGLPGKEKLVYSSYLIWNGKRKQWLGNGVTPRQGAYDPLILSAIFNNHCHALFLLYLGFFHIS